MHFQHATDAFTLKNGVKIPCIGFGTWQSADGPTAENAVREAIEAGYRHIDTAAIYHNERSVGRRIKDSGIKREDIFRNQQGLEYLPRLPDNARSFRKNAF